VSNSNFEVFQDQHRNRDPFTVSKEQFLNALAADKRLPARQRASAFKVAWKLTTLANRNMFKELGRLRAWPGLETMANDLAMTKHTVIDAIHILEVAGYLGVIQGKAGRKTPNMYDLLIPNSAESALFNLSENNPGRGPFPANEIVHSVTEIVHSGHINSALSAPEPLDITLEDSPERVRVPNRNPRKGATIISPGGPSLRSGPHPSHSRTRAESGTQGEQKIDPSHEGQHYREGQIPLPTEPSLASGAERDEELARKRRQKKRYHVWSECDCGHVEKIGLGFLLEDVEKTQSELDEAQCSNCSERGKMIVAYGEKLHIRRGQHTAAYLERGSGLFGGGSGQPPEYPDSSPDSDEQRSPIDRDDFERHIESQPDYSSPSDDGPEPDDYDYASLSAAE